MKLSITKGPRDSESLRQSRFMSGFDKSSVTLGSKSQLGSGSQTVNLVLIGVVRVHYCPHMESKQCIGARPVLKTGGTERYGGRVLCFPLIHIRLRQPIGLQNHRIRFDSLGVCKCCHG